ncbi:Aminodeoxychorismate synthase component 1 [Corynebacterium choanae]|uniref:aminodeoxychorismate synthase n=2 Tax=Corynebacterium choanae TaxID=1862358 RepID=A0A3G6J3Y1_9CORY|nr:Aminodeoxychorismate synthase component 1 [Corynebacterium choanae]
MRTLPAQAGGITVAFIDNEDSFSRLLLDAIWQAIGVTPVVIPRTMQPDQARDTLAQADVIVVGPGPGHPANPADVGISALALTVGKPVVGVCLGHQLIALQAGATVSRAAFPQHGVSSKIQHHHTGVFAGIANPMTVMRYHSLDVTIDDDSLPLEVLATAADGTVMMLRHTELPQWGMQFHPESFGTPQGTLLLRNVLLQALGVDRWPDTYPAAAWLEFANHTLLAAGTQLLSAAEVQQRRTTPPADPPWIVALSYEATELHDGGALTGPVCGFIPSRWISFPGRRAIDPDPILPPPLVDAPQLRTNQHTYEQQVRSCQEHIAAGDAYELCLTTAVTGQFTTTDSDRHQWMQRAWQLYRRVRQLTDAPFTGILTIAESSNPPLGIISASPERFLCVDNDTVITQPMKGTRPRGATPAQDAALRAELAASEKDRAENMMIVDVLRNDVLRSCAPGSVTVPALQEVHTFTHWHQMISTITGRLTTTPLQAVVQAFPGGSMTGAPKQRAMQLLAAIEGHPRGWYSGALGYLGVDRSDVAMLIRTLVITGDSFTYGAGGAVTRLSDPAEEFAEVQAKLYFLEKLLAAPITTAP